MFAPLSNDFCERVVVTILRGESVRCVATRFKIAASVMKWLQRNRATR